MPILHADATPVARLSRPATGRAAAPTPGFPAAAPDARACCAYRLTYNTPGIGGAMTTASALVVLPRGGARRLRTVVYEHGTLVRRRDAPSGGMDNYAAQAATLIAGARGAAVVAPDYLGLGSGAGADRPTSTRRPRRARRSTRSGRRARSRRAAA